MTITLDVMESEIPCPARPLLHEEARTVHSLVLLGFSAYLGSVLI